MLLLIATHLPPTPPPFFFHMNLSFFFFFNPLYSDPEKSCINEFHNKTMQHFFLLLLNLLSHHFIGFPLVLHYLLSPHLCLVSRLKNVNVLNQVLVKIYVFLLIVLMFFLNSSLFISLCGGCTIRLLLNM